MSQALCFQSVEFNVIQQNQQPWVRGYQIGSALGYTAPDVQISKLYTRHADEFTPAMTTVVTLPTDGGPQETRIFSLRGCHLLAMFARTPVAKAFRKWCLDVIEQYGDRVPVEPSSLPDESPSFPGSVSVTPSTVEDRKPLRALVNAWAHVSAQPFNVCWTQLKAAFRLTDIRDLPQEWIPDALAWVQEKIDALPSSPTLSPASTFRTDFPADMAAGRKDALRKIRSIMSSLEAARSTVSLFCYPAQRTMDMPRARRLSYDAQHDFYAAALDCLSAAHAALEAGYMLERSNTRG